MVVLGITIALIMTRCDTVVLHQKDVEPFLSIPFVDMIILGTCPPAATPGPGATGANHA